jgi:hypothetical protein
MSEEEEICRIIKQGNALKGNIQSLLDTQGRGLLPRLKIQMAIAIAEKANRQLEELLDAI